MELRGDVLQHEPQQVLGVARASEVLWSSEIVRNSWGAGWASVARASEVLWSSEKPQRASVHP